MTEKPDWDDQFRETSEEIAARWRRIKAKRKAEGKCWQCAFPIPLCACTNITHAAT